MKGSPGAAEQLLSFTVRSPLFDRFSRSGWALCFRESLALLSGPQPRAYLIHRHHAPAAHRGGQHQPLAWGCHAGGADAAAGNAAEMENRAFHCVWSPRAVEFPRLTAPRHPLLPVSPRFLVIS